MPKTEEDAAIPVTVLALERAALDRWGKGDPAGYLEIYAPDITYFDPAVPLRIDGLGAMQQYYAPITGKVSIHRFEFLNPHVRVNGETAILTYNLVNYLKDADGAESIGTRWNVTAAYQFLSGDWKIVHAHFSYTERP